MSAATPPDATTSSNTAITTATAGDVFAFGQLRLWMNCPAGATNCSFTAGLYIDGNPIPGSWSTETVGQGTTTSHDLDAFGLAENVSAGPHTIRFGWKSTSTNHAAWSSTSGNRGAAILLGG